MNVFLPFVVNFVSGILSEVEVNPTMTKKKWQNPVVDSLKKKKNGRVGGIRVVK